VRRTEIRHPLGWSPNGGGLTIAHGLKVVWTCDEDASTCQSKWKLNFIATEQYEMWATDARTMEREDIHVDIDWNYNLAMLSRLLPAEHQRYSSATACNLAALAALANASQYAFESDSRQFWHDLSDFFPHW
jgi:hypothetical protein